MITWDDIKNTLKSFSIAKLADKLSNNVQPVDNLTGSLEAILLAFVGPVSTWLVALPNTILVVNSSEALFGIGGAWAWVVALAFEGVGQSLANHWVQAKQWNEQNKDRQVNAKGAGARMCLYFAIDLVMVGLLAATKFNERGWMAFLTLVFPVVVIIDTLTTNDRSTLYRLRRERERLQIETQPQPGNDARFTEIEARLSKTERGLENRQLITAKFADFEAALSRLNGSRTQFIKSAKPQDVIALMLKNGRSTTPTSAGRFLKEVRK